MAKFDSYPDNSAPADADLLISTDVSDTSADASGTTKKLTVSTLLNSGLDATVRALDATSGDFTGVVKLESAAAVLEWKETDASADEGRVQARMVSGQWRLRRVNDAGGSFIDPIQVDPDGSISLAAAPSVSVPTPTAVDHAVKVVAWDDTTGRYAVQGPNGTLEQGDTGWRDISTELINGWVAGSTPPQVRRVGMTVFYRGDIDGTSRTDTNFWVAPSGFRPGSARFNASVVSSNRAEGFAMLYAATSNGSNLNINPLATTATVYWLLGVSHPVATDAWPTSLPGTAA